MGGRGLKEIKATIQAEEQGLREYIWSKKDSEPLIQAVWEVNPNAIQPQRKKVWAITWAQDTSDKWKSTPLHGQYATQVSRITDEEHAFQWMKVTGLKIETEALITAAQEQALNTKQHQAKVLHTSTDSLCRMCKSADETVSWK